MILIPCDNGAVVRHDPAGHLFNKSFRTTPPRTYLRTSSDRKRIFLVDSEKEPFQKLPTLGGFLRRRYGGVLKRPSELKIDRLLLSGVEACERQPKKNAFILPTRSNLREFEEILQVLFK
jgi:hypothetical protein